MKRYYFPLIPFWFIVWLVACTPTFEPAYEQAAATSTRETTVPTPTLILATPVVITSTATAVPTLTFTPTNTPTTVPPTIPPASETPTITPTAVPLTETAVSPTIQAIQVITATQPATDTLPMAQTPTPGWQYYVSDPHGLSFQYPAHWAVSPDFAYRLEGNDGFVELLATNSQDNLLVNACNDAAYGTAVPIEWLTVAGQEACLIQTDDGSRATLIVRFPELRKNLVPGVAYAFLVLQADPAHMPGFIQTLTFFTPADTPTPMP